MSLQYAEERIKEAIKLHGKNNPTKIRQQIIVWSQQDPKLLQAIAKPHLTGIVAYQVDRVLSGRSEKARKAGVTPAREAPPTPSADDSFGMEIMKAVAGNSGAVFGLEGGDAPRKSGQVSKQHIDALRMMAAKNKSKD